MKRDEAEKLICMIVGGSRRSAMHEEYGEEDEVNESNRIVEECRAKLLTALTGSDRPEVDLHGEIMNIPVDDEAFAKAVAESLTSSFSGTAFELAYKLGHRDARHAAAEIVTGTWRKVEP